ncbi:hypothetical protein KC364_g87 [Hortaea werneckii]|nr:hypothetical protein KC364_g87 [Hortaea werneckii]
MRLKKEDVGSGPRSLIERGRCRVGQPWSRNTKTEIIVSPFESELQRMLTTCARLEKRKTTPDALRMFETRSGQVPDLPAMVKISRFNTPPSYSLAVAGRACA